MRYLDQHCFNFGNESVIWDNGNDVRRRQGVTHSTNWSSVYCVESEVFGDTYRYTMSGCWNPYHLGDMCLYYSRVFVKEESAN